MADNLEIIFGAIIAFLVWMQLRTQSRMKAQDIVLRDKDTALQKIEDKGDQQQAQLDILRESVSGTFKAQEQWQIVVSTMSERRHLDNERLVAALDKSSESNDRLNDTLDKQQARLINLETSVQGVKDSVQAKLDTIEAHSQANRADVTQALGLSVEYRNMNDSNLRTLQQAIDSVFAKVSEILTKAGGDHTLELRAIKAQLQLITDTIAPRPALLGVTPAGSSAAPPPDIRTAVPATPRTASTQPKPSEPTKKG